jgi:hypothetical protein
MDVLWSNASGSVLIGVIPDSGGGRVGVISRNEFTPLTMSPGLRLGLFQHLVTGGPGLSSARERRDDRAAASG